MLAGTSTKIELFIFVLLFANFTLFASILLIKYNPSSNNELASVVVVVSFPSVSIEIVSIFSGV